MNYNLSINLELIRTIYNWLSQKTTSLNATEIMNRFYKYVDEDFYSKEIAKPNTTEDAVIKQCKDRYDNFVKNAFIEKSVANKLIESGIPANCLRTDSATKLLPLNADEYSSPQSIFEYQLFDFVDQKISLNILSDVLTKKDIEKLDSLLANIPSEKICFILVLVHYLMKQIHFTYMSASDGFFTFMNMLENATYDPNNESEVALMKHLYKVAQSYTENDKVNIDDLFENNADTIEHTNQITDSSETLTIKQKKRRRTKMTELEKDNKKSQAEYNNGIIGDNALLIRESCKLVAESMGFGGKNFSKKFYNFLRCSNTSYDHFVMEGYINDEIKQTMISYGIPQKCFNKNTPMLIPVSNVIEHCLQEIRYPDVEAASEDVVSKNDLIDALEYYLFKENPTDSNILFSSAKRIVQAIYESTCFAPDTSEALFDLLAEMELDGTDFKYKDMKKQLEEIAKSYYENELIEKDEDTQNA